MKILHYSPIYAPAWKWGGPPRSVANLAEGLAVCGHDVSVFTTDAGLEHDSTLQRGREISRNGVRVTYYPATFRFTGLYSKAAVADLKRRAGEFDVVHISGVWQTTGVQAARAARKANVPYLVSPRGMLGPYSFSQRALKKRLFWWLIDRPSLRRASALHATSIKEAEELRKLIPNLPVVSVPNAIDLTAWQRDQVGASNIRRKLGLAEHDTLLLVSGRLHHKKGLDLIPTALATARSERKWHLVFAGPNEDATQEHLAALFQQAGQLDKVTFWGQCDTKQLTALYSASDLLLFPSRHENFGNVAVEALACGCPVLLSDGVGAACDLHDINGVVIRPLDTGKWSLAIESVLNRVPNPEFIAQRHKCIQDRFSPAAVSKQMITAYRDIISIAQHSEDA